MKKKILRLFICFLAAISCFLFNNDIVKADDEIEIDSNGTPGSGGKDPCDPWSYVCIYNYAAFKVTYYPAEGTPKSKIYYTDKYKSNPFIKNGQKQLKGRFSEANKFENINFKDFKLGSVPKKFTSIEAQGMYKKLWDQMKKKDSKIVTTIFQDLTNTSSTGIDDFVRSNPDAYFFIEPIYQVKIQGWNDAHKALSTKVGNFKNYFGTANGVAKKVAKDSFNGCKNETSVQNCKEIFESRKEKGHVSRIANSLRLENKVTVGNFSLLAGNPKAKRYKTEMVDLTGDKGYGIGAIKLRSYPINDNPPEEQHGGTCYSYFENKFDAACDESADNYQTEIEEVTVGESTPNAQSCIDGYPNSNGSRQSQSVYGEKTNITAGSNPVGKYCAIYCTKDIKFSTDIGNIVGAKEISPLPNIANSSTTYTEKFKIEKEIKYTCHADVTKHYGTDTPTDEWFKILSENNYAEAYYDIEKLKKEYDAIPDPTETNVDDFNNQASKILSELRFCAYYYPYENDDGFEKNGSISINVGDEKKVLKQVSSNSEFISATGNTEDDNDIKVNWDGQPNTFGGYIKSVEKYVNDIINQSYTYYTNTAVYSLSSTSKYDLNLKKQSNPTADKEYGDVDDENINDNSVCNIKQKLIEKNQKENIDKVSIDNHENMICESKIEYSPNIVAECPANTYHAGTNAYYWLANSLINDDSLKKKALDGVNSTEAIDMFCNNKTLEKFDGGYEQIINEDGSAVLDDCLMAGVPLNQCQENAGKTYKCTDGQGIRTDVSYFVYLKAKEKGITNFDNKTQMNTILKSIEKENPYCNDSCYNGDKNSKTFVYRTISLGDKKTSFPGKNGKGRTPGSNWNSDSLIEKIITNRQDVYNNEPMYKIVLDYSTLKNIRSDNKQIKYDYGNFNNLDCNENGTACISKFLREKISVSGKCSRLDKENFYTNCN